MLGLFNVCFLFSSWLQRFNLLHLNNGFQILQNAPQFAPPREQPQITSYSGVNVLERKTQETLFFFFIFKVFFFPCSSSSFLWGSREWPCICWDRPTSACLSWWTNGLCNSLVMSRGDTGVEILVFQWDYWISIYKHQFCCSLRVMQRFRGKAMHDFLIAFPLGGPGGLLACSHLQPLTAQPRGSWGTRNASNLASRPPCFWDCPSVPKMPAMGKPWRQAGTKLLALQ